MLFTRKKSPLSRILIVEDEPLIAFDVEHQLADAGFEIVATLDRAGDALALIEQGVPIDLIVLDIMLADGTGIGVARAAVAAGIRVLFASGACPAEAAALADGWIGKPYAPRALLGAIEAIAPRAPRLAPPAAPDRHAPSP